MTVRELIEAGPYFSRYEVYGNDGELRCSYNDAFAVFEVVGDCEVMEWSAHASAPGFANDYLVVYI